MMLATLKNIQLNSNIIIETVNNEVIHGVVSSYHKDYSYIELDNAVQLNRNYNYSNVQCLHLKQIQAILILDPTNQEEELSLICNRLAMRKRFDMLSSPVLCPETDVLDAKYISTLDWQHIDKQLKNIVVIRQCDYSYYKACEDISKRKVISLQMHPMLAGRTECMPLLTITTNTFVYIFDLLALQNLGKELSCILSAELPRKITFRSNYICDYLEHTWHIKMKGIFDIFVAYCLLNSINLKNYHKYQFFEIASDMLQIPADYVKIDKKFNAFHRPLDGKHLEMLAKRGIMQGFIYRKFIYDTMFEGT